VGVAETNLHVHAKTKRSKSLFFSLEVWVHKWLDARLSESEAAGYHGERWKRLQVQTKERALEEALKEALRVSAVALLSEARRCQPIGYFSTGIVR
jgi:RNA binding exosome subunit